MNFVDKVRKWPIKIRLYPELPTSSLYCLAHIWPDHKTLVKEFNKLPYVTPVNKIKEGNGTDKVAATTMPVSFRYKKDNRLSPVFSHIHFSTEYLQEFFLSHEVLHATINWQIRAKLHKGFMFYNKVTRDEERFCYAHGVMLWQLISRLTKLGLY